MSGHQHSIAPQVDAAAKNSTTQKQENAQGQASIYTESDPPPHYTVDAATRDLLALREGDPEETIEVPFVYSHDSKSVMDYLRLRNVGKVTRRIVARPMSRRLYNERYAHDQNGNFVGTGVRAPDAGLVLIPSKSTEQDLLDQVSRFARTRKQDPGAHKDGYGMMTFGGFGIGT